MNIWRHWYDLTPSGKRWGYTWCAPCADMSELEWRLRHGEISKTDALAAASIISCYRVLVEMSEKDRRRVLREVRQGPTKRNAESENDGTS